MAANHKIEAVVIGTSAGGVEALCTILPQLPANYPLPVMVVIHVPPDRPSLLAEVFGARCKMKVVEATDKITRAPGTIYFAPADYHLLLDAGGLLSLSVDEPRFFSRPSIDVLFESAADCLRDKVLGVILTGASQDGAAGLATIGSAGGICLVQEPTEAVAKEMPSAALAACDSARTLLLENVSAELLLAAGLPADLA